MTRQLNYIVPGFLLALMIPIAGSVVEKISQTDPADNPTVTITDAEKAKQGLRWKVLPLKAK